MPQGPYGALLKDGLSAWITALGLFGRLGFLAGPLCLVFLGQEAGSSGPALAAAFSLGAAVGFPLTSSWAARLGPRRVLVGASVAAFGFGVAATAAPTGRAALLALSAASFPPVGPVLRSRWPAVVDDERRRAAARALESSLTEILIVVGPLAVSVLVALTSGRVAWLVLLGAMLVSTIMVAALLEPLPTVERRLVRRMTTLLTAPVGWLLVTVLLAASGLAAAEIFMATTLIAAGAPAYQPGLLLGVLGVSSAISGLWFGSRAWTAPTGPMYASGLAVSGSALGCAVLGVGGGGLTLGLLLVPLAGPPIAVTAVLEFTILERLVSPPLLPVGVALILSANSLGAAAGAALTGWALTTASPAVVVAVGSVLLMAAGALIGLRRFPALPE